MPKKIQYLTDQLRVINGNIEQFRLDANGDIVQAGNTTRTGTLVQSGGVNLGGQIVGSNNTSIFTGNGTAHNYDDYYTTGGGYSPSANQVCKGFIYNGAAGGAVVLQLPTAIQLVSQATTNFGTGPIGGAGAYFALPMSVINVTDANNLTITAGVGGTVLGTAIVNNESALLFTFFNSGNTTIHVVIGN